MDKSLNALCRRLQSSGAFEGVSALRAAPLLKNAEHASQFARVAAHFGFAPAREAGPHSSGIRDFGSNFVSLMLIAARNPAAAHAGLLLGLNAPLFLSRKRVEKRYSRRTNADAIDD